MCESSRKTSVSAFSYGFQVYVPASQIDARYRERLTLPLGMVFCLAFPRGDFCFETGLFSALVGELNRLFPTISTTYMIPTFSWPVPLLPSLLAPLP